MTKQISGRELRNARQRMGYRTQVDAAEAMGISVRLYADFERLGVPEKYLDDVRRVFWPARAGAGDATPLDDIDLLEEVGRRWAQYRKDQRDALEPVEALRRDLREALERAERAEAALAEFTAMAARYGSQNDNHTTEEIAS